MSQICQQTTAKTKSKITSRSHLSFTLLHALIGDPKNINFFTLRFLKYSPDKILKVKVTTARSTVKKLHHDIAYVHSTTMSLPSIKFLQLTISKICPRMDLRSRPLWKCQRSNQGHTLHYTPTPTANVPTKYQRSTQYSF